MRDNDDLTTQSDTGCKGYLQSHGQARRAMRFTAVSSLLRDKGFEGSAVRILELAEMKNTEEGEEPLSLASALGFREFISEFTALGEPVLGIFPEGTLSSGWRVADNKHLLLEFLDESNVSYAMIGPDDDASDGKFRLNGRANRKKVLDILSENGVTRWQL